jgi:hypothetical protein
VTYSLPSVFLVLGKEALCRVSRKKTLGKRKDSAKKLFDECFIFDTRQRVYLPSIFFDTWQRALCRVSQIQHSAKSSLPSVFSSTLGKDNFKITFKVVN